MNDDQSWKEKLSGFFLENNHWKTACDTVDAVDAVHKYWRNQFWEVTKKTLHDNLEDPALWEFELDTDDGDVSLYPKDKNDRCVQISVNEDEGGYFGIWVDKNISIHRNSNAYKKLEFLAKDKFGFEYQDEGFFKLNVIKNLHEKLIKRDSIYKIRDNEFKDAIKLATQTSDFIKNGNIHELLLSF